MNMLAILVLAVGISLDGLAAGIAYGLRCVRVPLTSVGIASFISGAAVLVSMQAGNVIGHYLSSAMLPRFGAVLLVGLGIWGVVQGRRKSEILPPAEALASRAEDMILNLHLQPFGLVVQILREPLTADLDCSGVISGWEALLLGVALALDAMGVGIAAALVGFPLVATCVSVMVVSFLALSGGLLIGRGWAGQTATGSMIWRYLPSSVLILMGLWWFVTAGG